MINAHGYCDDTSFDFIEKCAMSGPFPAFISLSPRFFFRFVSMLLVHVLNEKKNMRLESLLHNKRKSISFHTKNRHNGEQQKRDSSSSSST